MSNARGTLSITFNGEIFNFKELRQVLESSGASFCTESDTEVIIQAYERWGISCVHRLRGLFAFALWDETRGELHLVRDRVGIKPLHYFWDGQVFVFASEIKAILAVEGVAVDVDRSAIFDYLTHLYVPAPKTVYRQIRKLEPGFVLTLAGQTVKLSRYWDVPLCEDSGMTERVALELVRGRLQDAVRANMVSDVPVGAFLSGGLDSSTVVAHMVKCQADVRTFAVGFDVASHSETAFARIVAEAFGTSHEEKTVGGQDPAQMLARIVDAYDEPFADGSALPTFRLSEFARQHVKVVLSGDGGDEVFAGYTWHGRWLRQQALRRILPRFVRLGLGGRVARGWPSRARGQRLRHVLSGMGLDPLEQYGHEVELFTPAEKRDLLGPDWAEEFRGYDDYWYLRKYWRPEIPGISRVQYLDIKTYLPDDILTKVDRASMACGLEVRPPLLDHLLIEAVFSIPARLRYKHGVGKYLIRRLMNDRLPATILRRRKKGFSAPLHDWLGTRPDWARRYGGVAERFFSIDRLGLIDGRAWGAKCWAALALEHWSELQRTPAELSGVRLKLAEGEKASVA